MEIMYTEIMTHFSGEEKNVELFAFLKNIPVIILKLTFFLGPKWTAKIYGLFCLVL